MSRKYKFYEKSGAYFVSFATVYWIDLFIREDYFQTIIQSLDYCRKQKGMILYGYCIMPSHIHLLFQAKDQNPSDLIRDFKTFTSKMLIQQIKTNPQESRKEWLLWMFTRAAKTRNSAKQYQLWQHHNQPIAIYSQKFFDEKLNYIHKNPIVSGFVCEAFEWKYSSARNYANNLPVLLDIDICQ
ncbi:TPA: transposase [Mannheimia haemolytica]|nr:transposase [Mannheimia haemolytica]